MTASYSVKPLIQKKKQVLLNARDFGALISKNRQKYERCSFRAARQNRG